jgi:acyl-CoA thioester hydrolase
MEELLAGYPVCTEVPVSWGDMDALGHVNNVVYIRWLENGRVAYLAGLGEEGFLANSGVGPILASINCRFKAPVTYPDSVIIGTRVSELGADRLTFRHRIVSRSLGRVVAEGEGVMVSYDYSRGSKAPLPDAVRAAVEQLQQEPSP